MIASMSSKGQENDLFSVGFHNLERKNVLDLGCGQRFPFALQWASEGADVTALHPDYVKPRFPAIGFRAGLQT